MECHLKWNLTQNEMSLKMECHSKWGVTQNGMSLKMECHSKWHVTQNEISLKMECYLNWNQETLLCRTLLENFLVYYGTSRTIFKQFGPIRTILSA